MLFAALPRRHTTPSHTSVTTRIIPLLLAAADRHHRHGRRRAGFYVIVIGCLATIVAGHAIAVIRAGVCILLGASDGCLGCSRHIFIAAATIMFTTIAIIAH